MQVLEGTLRLEVGVCVCVGRGVQFRKIEACSSGKQGRGVQFRNVGACSLG
jgi:hypothetical protein